MIIRAFGELPEDVGCIDPEGTQARDEKKLLEREKTAHDKRGLSLITDKDGAGRYIRGYLDSTAGAIIAAALDGLSAPIAATAAACHRRDQTPDHHHHPAQLTAERDRRRTTQ